MGYGESFEKWKSEISRATYKEYMSEIWRLTNVGFAEWWNMYLKTKEKIDVTLKSNSPINLKEVSTRYDDFVVSAINLWGLLMEFAKIGNDKREEIMELVLRLPISSNEKDAIKVWRTLAHYVRKLVPISDTVDRIELKG